MPRKKGPISKWDQRFIDLAKFVSEWSKDPNAKVGAVVVSNEGGAIALGYNGFPAGIEDDDRLDSRDRKLDMIIHAEQNALLIAGSRAKGASLYVWGKPICSRCGVLIIQAGIERIVAPDPEDEVDKNSTWYKLGVLAVKTFEEVDMEMTFYQVPITAKH